MSFPIIIWIAVFLGLAAEIKRSFDSQKIDYEVANESIAFGKFITENILAVIVALGLYVSGMLGAGFADIIPTASVESFIPSFLTGMALWNVTKATLGKYGNKTKNVLRKIVDKKTNKADGIK